MSNNNVEEIVVGSKVLLTQNYANFQCQSYLVIYELNTISFSKFYLKVPETSVLKFSPINMMD